MMAMVMTMLPLMRRRRRARALRLAGIVVVRRMSKLALIEAHENVELGRVCIDDAKDQVQNMLSRYGLSPTHSAAHAHHPP